MKHKKFEYITEILDYHHSWGHEKRFNELGNKGWEMCGMYTNGRELIFYFKREKLEE